MTEVTRRWHWFDWSLFGLRTCWFLAGVYYSAIHPHPDLVDVPYWPAFFLFIAAYFVPMIFWRPSYVHAVCFSVAELLLNGGLFLYLLFGEGKFLPILGLPSLLLGFMWPKRTGLWTIQLLVLVLPFSGLLVETVGWTQVIPASIDTTLSFAFGYSLNRVVHSNQRMKQLLEENRRQYQLIQEQNRALVQYASQIEQLAIVEERNRMARELHDTVGHTFTSVIMGMDAVMYLIDTAPEKAKAKLEVLRNVTRNGLDEVRRNIHQIAENREDLPLSLQLTRLANEFALHTGTNVRLDKKGNEYEVSQQVKWTFIRCLQESLTNAKRHGQATKVQITLEYRPGEIRLQIEDDGVGAENLKCGFGLTAMKERVAALQGTVKLETGPGQGMVVICSVPV